MKLPRFSPSKRYLKAAWVATKREPARHTHALTELGDGMEVPADLRRHLADLAPDYTVSRDPDAANGVPYEMYDAPTAETKVQHAEVVIEWLRQKITSSQRS